VDGGLFRHDTSVSMLFFVPSELQPRAHTCNLSHMLCVQEIAGGERYLCVNRDVEVCLMCLNIIVLPECICSDFAPRLRCSVPMCSTENVLRCKHCYLFSGRPAGGTFDQ
jgi:hypothetical protein